MKKYLSLLLVFALVLLSGYAFAQEPGAVAASADQALEAPAWLKVAVEFLMGLPYVGPVAVEIVKWSGLVAGICTALVLLVQSLSAAFQGAAILAGFGPVAEKIKKYGDIVIHYLKMLSMFNAQKKPPQQ